AAHSNSPASSRMSVIRMMAMKVAVAFHTKPHTTGMSARFTVPRAIARAAPSEALQPMFSPRGCQMTRTTVNRNMMDATTTELSRCVQDRRSACSAESPQRSTEITRVRNHLGNRKVVADDQTDSSARSAHGTALGQSVAAGRDTVPAQRYLLTGWRG